MKPKSPDEKRVAVGIRITPEMRAFFEEIAEAEGRTLSNTIAITLENVAFGTPQEWRKEVILGQRKKKT